MKLNCHENATKLCFLRHLFHETQHDRDANHKHITALQYYKVYTIHVNEFVVIKDNRDFYLNICFALYIDFRRRCMKFSFPQIERVI